jgi:hypothetical protein
MIGTTAWLSVGSLLTTAAIGWGTFNIVDLVAHEMETRTVTVDAAGIDLIDVVDDAGSVTIESADVDQITVRARIGHGLKRSGSSVVVDGNRVVVRGSCPVLGSQWCDVRYTITVPADIDVVARSDDNSIRAAGLDGDVDLRSDNGSVRVTDLGGDVRLQSDNGAIDARALTGTTVRADADNGSVSVEMLVAPRSVQLSSNNGRVTLVLPTGDELYAVDISSQNGGVDNQLRVDPKSERTVVISSDNGTATARYAA